MSKKQENPKEDIEQQEKKQAKPMTAQIQKIKEFLEESYDVRFNSITQQLEYREKNTIGYEQFTDQIKTDIVIQLKQLFFKKPKEDLDDLLNSSMIPRFDPIKEYFNALSYEGEGYIDRLCRCIVIDDPDRIIEGKPYKQLFRSYFEKWLTACYLCSTGKLVNDVMLILIGAQGRFKTSFLNFLTPKKLEDYRVCAHLNPSLSDYNTSNYLAEKFFINVDDQMETIFGKDYNSMKPIISAPDITNRKLYKASHQRRRRIANFCGSVNESRFLRDSNNRRYLCFAISDIKADYINIDMDAVWAEVKRKADKANITYLFGKEDYKMIDQMNSAFEAPTEEAETLQTVFMPAPENSNGTVYYMQFTEIMQTLRIESGNNQLKAYNLQTAMRKYGYTTTCVRKARFNNQPRNLYRVQLLQPNQNKIDRLFYYQ